MIFLPTSTASTQMSGFEFLYIIAGCVYFLQLVVVWCEMIIMDSYNSKLEFLYWNIPFLPYIIAGIQKFLFIGK